VEIGLSPILFEPQQIRTDLMASFWFACHALRRGLLIATGQGTRQHRNFRKVEVGRVCKTGVN
jgi:hypothetical protein